MPADEHQSALEGRIGAWLTTVLWALGLGLSATALGWPLAWWVRRRPRTACVWIVTPMLMPSYLAYAGWGLLRAPGTWLGDRLELAAEHGARWAPVLAGHVLAFVGLSLWAAPIAAIVTALGLRSIDASVVESLRLERGSAWTRGLTLLSIAKGSVLASIAVVGALMLGSAVPLHLAQVRTIAIDLWQALDTTPANEHWRVWAQAWPLLVTAVAGGWWIGGRATDGMSGGASVVDANAGFGARRAWDGRASVAVVALAVLGPLALFTVTLHRAASLGAFWTLNADAVRDSGRIALAVGAVSAGVMIVVAWRGSASTNARGVRACVRALIALGVVPGVLVGSLVARTVGRWPMVGDSWAVVAVAHLARFGFVPALLGCWMARTEPAAQRNLRRLEVGGSFLGWRRTALAPAAGPIVACGIGCAILSLHEIESTVQVVPPGESLARQILQYLHFSRMEEMSAAGVWLVGGGGVLALLAGVLLRPWVRKGQYFPPPSPSGRGPG